MDDKSNAKATADARERAEKDGALTEEQRAAQGIVPNNVGVTEGAAEHGMDKVGIPRGVGSAIPGKPILSLRDPAMTAPFVETAAGTRQLIPRHNDGEYEAKAEQEAVQMVHEAQGTTPNAGVGETKLPQFQGGVQPKKDSKAGEALGRFNAGKERDEKDNRSDTFKTGTGPSKPFSGTASEVK